MRNCNQWNSDVSRKTSEEFHTRGEGENSSRALRTKDSGFPEEVRRDVVATLESLRVRTKIPMQHLLTWAKIHKSRFDRWRHDQRCTAHKPAPRIQASAILPEERDAIIEYRRSLHGEGVSAPANTSVIRIHPSMCIIYSTK
ncbi:MAG: hypothetical protein HYX66_03575 [Ignavibacteria bacterium]|nr:hypothetical protein [Ignavibacteria bacterium]